MKRSISDLGSGHDPQTRDSTRTPRLQATGRDQLSTNGFPVAAPVLTQTVLLRVPHLLGHAGHDRRLDEPAVPDLSRVGWCATEDHPSALLLGDPDAVEHLAELRSGRDRSDLRPRVTRVAQLGGRARSTTRRTTSSWIDSFTSNRDPVMHVCPLAAKMGSRP